MTKNTIPVSMRRHIRNLADAMARSAKTPITNAPVHKISWGVVGSIQTGPPQTLTVNVSGAGVGTAGLRYLSSYSPTVGDTVMMSKYGGDLVVLGGMNGVTTSVKLEIPMTFAVIGTLTARNLPVFFEPVPSTQIVKLIGIRAKIASGTSIDIDVEHNGSGVSGLTGLSVTPTSTSHILGTFLTLGNDDEIGISMSSPVGAPTDLSGSLFLSFMSGA